MAINMIQPGHSMEYSNSGSAISSGDVVVVSGRCGIAVSDIAATTGKGTLALSGVFEITSDTGTAYNQGDQLFYDSGNSRVTKTAAGNTPIGIAHEAKASGGTSALVRLGDHPKQAAVVAALGAPTAVTGVDGSGSNAASKADVDARLTAIHTKIDAILSAMKAAGLMANS